MTASKSRGFSRLTPVYILSGITALAIVFAAIADPLEIKDLQKCPETAATCGTLSKICKLPNKLFCCSENNLHYCSCELTNPCPADEDPSGL